VVNVPGLPIKFLSSRQLAEKLVPMKVVPSSVTQSCGGEKSMHIGAPESKHHQLVNSKIVVFTTTSVTIWWREGIGA